MNWGFLPRIAWRGKYAPIVALTVVAFILRFFSPLFPDLYAHRAGEFSLSNCVSSTPVNASGQRGRLCGLAYPFQKGTRSSANSALAPPHGEIFDEIYFADFAHDDLLGVTYYDPEPPLGKLFMAAGEYLYGMYRSVFEGAKGNYADLGFNPFGWRIMEALFGTLCIPLLYLLARRLYDNQVFALSAAFLACFDGMFFIQSRIGMIDIYPIFFILLSYYVFHVHLASKTTRSSLITLLLTGISVGLAVSAKWIALAVLSSMLLILCVRALRPHVRFSFSAPLWSWGKEETIPSSFPGGVPVLAYIGVGLVAFLLIPIAIYIASWIPFFERGQFTSLYDLWKYQVASYTYHANLTATHPYGSAWYSWPFLFRPVAYYFESSGLGIDANSGQQLVAGMVNLGNPLIWWASIPCVLLLPYYIFKDKSYPAAFILLGFVTQYLPFSHITRVMFLYHMFAGLIFMILALSFVLSKISLSSFTLSLFSYVTNPFRGQSLVIIYMVWVVLAFVYFYPVWTGLPIGYSQYLGGFGIGRMWFPSWI